MLGRRKFLGTLTAAAATTLVSPGIANAIGLDGAQASLREQFTRLVGNDFRLVDDAGKVQIARLVTLDEGPTAPDLEQFSVVFEGDDLTEGLYRVYHPQTGGLDVGFISSGESGADSNRQRAYFSDFV